MDDARFDALTRFAARKGTRRDVLRAIGAAAGGLGLAGLGGGDAGAIACRGAGSTCAKAAHCCSGVCEKDATGRRRCVCPAGTKPCGGTCVDPGSCCADAECAAWGSACLKGVCDRRSGTCGAVPLADGRPCDDGNACTTGGAPVVCTAPDACHKPGTCNPDTGVCSDPTPTANFQTDETNCGSCGYNCGVSFKHYSSCIGGTCTCDERFTRDCVQTHCVELCSVFQNAARERFRNCFFDDPVVAGDCAGCRRFADCYGSLDTGVPACGTMTTDCDDL
ncbi:MAG TPA: hypothetical protein VH482_12135 [Thermomicrobiales bacterium]|jgi:hypothetical protein